jgi:hypothetical protein
MHSMGPCFASFVFILPGALISSLGFTGAHSCELLFAIHKIYAYACHKFMDLTV